MSAVASPAGFWKRYVAYFIDFVLVYIAVEIAGLLFFSVFGSRHQAELEAQLRALLAQSLAGTGGAAPPVTDPVELLAGSWELLWHGLVFGTVAWVVLGGAYFAGMEASPRQATLGKKLVGIKVTDRDGGRLTLGRAIARFLAAGLSWITLNLGHALAAWTPSRRALHDFVAGTRVLNADPANPGMPLWGWVIVGLHALAFVGVTLLAVLLGWLWIQAAGSVG